MELYWFVLFLLLALFIAAVLRRKSLNPKASYIMALLNILLNIPRILHLGPFKHGSKVDINTTVKRVAKKTRMSDFGDLSFLSDYQRVADLPFYKSLTFSNLGLIIAQGELEMVLKRRLQLVDYLNRFPSVSSVPIRSPVFVFGLGRSGTTFLHRLLSLDPSARAPLLWELVNPVPSVDGDAASDVMKADCDMRAKAIKDKLATRSILGDKTLENLHEIGYNLPEECLFSLADEIPFSFHYVYTCLLHLHQFRELIPSQRLLQAYYSHKKILQLLSYQTEGERDSPKRWVLKFPLHIFFLHELCAVFPDAKLIWYSCYCILQQIFSSNYC